VKKPSPPTSSEHPDALLLPYVEDTVTPAEKADVEEHLSTCDQCALRAEELREAIAELKQNKQAFCPEPWELHDFAQSGDDPHGVISLHVENCPLCSEDLRAWKMALPEEPMPAELWNRLRERLPGPAPRQVLPRTPQWGHIFLQNLVRWWKAPAMAAGVAAAVLLIVVIFHPWDMTQDWVPRPKSLPEKAAFVVFFKDFKDPPPQEQIESLYEALKPSTELNERYNFVSPAETSEVIKSGKVPSHDGSAMIDGLRKNLNVSRVLVITVFPSADKLAARIECIDTISGKTLQTKTEENMGLSGLAARVRSDAFGMLLPPTNQR
jgi:anti-sigma factor RsiW